MGIPPVNILGFRQPVSVTRANQRRGVVSSRTQDPDYYIEEPTEILEPGIMTAYSLERVARILFGASSLKSGSKDHAIRYGAAEEYSEAPSEIMDDVAMSTFFLERLSKHVGEVLNLKSVPASMAHDGTVAANKYQIAGKDYVDCVDAIMEDPDVSSAFLDKLARLVLAASNIGSPPKDRGSKPETDVESCDDTSRFLDDSLLAPFNLETGLGNLKLDDHGVDASVTDDQKGVSSDKVHHSSTKPGDISIYERMHCEFERSNFHKTSHAGVEISAAAQSAASDKHRESFVSTSAALVRILIGHSV